MVSVGYVIVEQGAYSVNRVAKQIPQDLGEFTGDFLHKHRSSFSGVIDSGPCNWSL